MTSSACCATDRQFDPAIAHRDLRRFLRRGPDPTTRQLVAAVEHAPLTPQPTLLDVGGGIGAIHHLLLDRGFTHAVQIDASAAYLAVAAEEADRRGHTGRVTFHHADFRAVGADVPPEEVVTLDRVVCCDPDYTGMLAAAAAHARRFLAFSYPRRRWSTRAVVVLANALRKLRGRAFRAYVHAPPAMSAVLERSGMRRRWTGGTWIWAVELFERAEAPSA